MIRFTGFRQWMGQSTCTSGVVGQLGMEMIPLCPSRSAAFTSGTTSGTSGSMRQAELSSMTRATALTAAGIMLLETSVVAEKKAMSTPANDLEFVSSTSISHSPTVRRRPAERLEASRRSPLTGKPPDPDRLKPVLPRKGRRGLEPAPEPGADEALLHPAPEHAGRAHLQLRLRLREEVALDVGGLPEASLPE